MNEHKRESLASSFDDATTDEQRTRLLESQPGSNCDPDLQEKKNRYPRLIIGFLFFSNIVLAILLGIEHRRNIPQPQPAWKPPEKYIKRVFQPSADTSGATGPESEKAWIDILPSMLRETSGMDVIHITNH